MFGEQELEYLRPLYVGETLTFQSRVTDVYEKQGKRTFDIVWVSFTAADEGGALALQGAQSYIIFKFLTTLEARGALFQGQAQRPSA